MEHDVARKPLHTFRHHALGRSDLVVVVADADHVGDVVIFFFFVGKERIVLVVAEVDIVLVVAQIGKVVAGLDVFVGLFYTKTGNFTEEEFDTAHRAFKATGRPRIYTYFKTPSGKSLDARPEDIQSLSTFQQKLAALGHFWTGYEDIEHLKRQFRDQLDKLLE